MYYPIRLSFSEHQAILPFRLPDASLQPRVVSLILHVHPHPLCSTWNIPPPSPSPPLSYFHTHPPQFIPSPSHLTQLSCSYTKYPSFIHWAYPTPHLRAAGGHPAPRGDPPGKRDSLAPPPSPWALSGRAWAAGRWAMVTMTGRGRAGLRWATAMAMAAHQAAAGPGPGRLACAWACHLARG